jgi:periplasmic protein TonB
MMPLRCLLFSSHAEIVPPIWQVLADLGIEGEYCQSAVDAVEKVTTQSFQIVITDWEDQPEAAFLLKTARDLKAAHRPLTLAIVSDDARRPEALQAGANSILLKPIRAEQVRETMSTACELLQSKLQPAAPPPARESGTAALAAAASAGAATVPAFVAQPPGNAREEESLQSPSSAPTARFYKQPEVRTWEEPTVPKFDAVVEPEPTAASVDTPAAPQLKSQETLTGWAMLQARLMRSAPPPSASAPAKSELLSYGETRSSSGRSAGPPAGDGKTPAKESRQDSESEATLFAYISGKSAQNAEPVAKARPKRGKVLSVAALAVVCVGLAVAPRTRQSLQTLYRNSIRTGSRLLNPPPAPLPQAVAMHDSFGQSGDEYKLPTPGNIPDATTDPSQIRVLPVIDPTAKPQKNPEATSGSEPAPSLENASTDPDQTAPNQDAPNQDAPNQNAQAHNAESDVKDAPPTSVGDVPRNPPEARPDAAPAQIRQMPSTPVVQSAAPQPPTTSSVPNSVPSHAVSARGTAGIPSSLKSQIASSTPLSSGSKPVEAAMSSIEPVNLPELVARELLIQPVDPEYPAAARASGQRGSVVLQLLIGRDGFVQDAKFLQGSLVFAKAAIEAVKQYRFKPYSLNGRAVSVQSVITLNFKPSA